MADTLATPWDALLRLPEPAPAPPPAAQIVVHGRPMDRVLSALEQLGNPTTAELATAAGLNTRKVRGLLRERRLRGIVSHHDGRWAMVPQPSPDTTEGMERLLIRAAAAIGLEVYLVERECKGGLARGLHYEDPLTGPTAWRPHRSARQALELALTLGIDIHPRPDLSHVRVDGPSRSRRVRPMPYDIDPVSAACLAIVQSAALHPSKFAD